MMTMKMTGWTQEGEQKEERGVTYQERIDKIRHWIDFIVWSMEWLCVSVSVWMRKYGVNVIVWVRWRVE